MREIFPETTNGYGDAKPELLGIDGAGHRLCEDKVMTNALPIIYLARHGETAWSLTGQHTGLTDLPLTERGEENAHALKDRLTGLNFGKVFTSPLQRATRTCELAGLRTVAEVDRNLLEWDYGQYEGLTTAAIHAKRPDWQLFRDGCPGGESPEQVMARADSMLGRVHLLGMDVLLFSSGHFLRVFAARWLALGAAAGRYLLLSTASLSALGYENNLSAPVIELWNDTRHVRASNLRDTDVQTQLKETSLWPQSQ
jgi:broad specificity phosphatase PhoE